MLLTKPLQDTRDRSEDKPDYLEVLLTKPLCCELNLYATKDLALPISDRSEDKPGYLDVLRTKPLCCELNLYATN